MTPTNSLACPRCGKDVDSNSRFCKHCAFDLTAKPSQPPVRGSLRTIFIVLAVVVPLTALVTILILRRGSTSQKFSVVTPSNNSTSVISPSGAPTIVLPTPTSNELTRELALSLIRGPLTRKVEAAMFDTGVNHAQTYDEMMQENVLNCTRGYFGYGDNCKPGPNGRQLRIQGHELILLIGSKVPSVTGISKVNDTSAVTDVVLTFQPGANYQFFSKWRSAFDFYYVKPQPVNYKYDDAVKQEQRSVHLRLFDDGWRMEKTD